MTPTVTVHVDDATGFTDPRLHVWYAGSARTEDLPPAGRDGFGPVFEVHPLRTTFGFTLRDSSGPDGAWEGVDRVFSPAAGGAGDGSEVWVRSGSRFTYRVE